MIDLFHISELSECHVHASRSGVLGCDREEAVDHQPDLLVKHIGVGIRFAQPPPPRLPPPPPPVPPAPRCAHECAVPSYYVEPVVYVAPVYPRAYPPPVVVDQRVVVRPARRLPRWGLGAFAGSMAVDGQESGADLGLIGRRPRRAAAARTRLPAPQRKSPHT